MWKWFFICLVTVTLICCGRPSVWEIPEGIDHPPIEESIANSSIDNSDNSSSNDTENIGELAEAGASSVVYLEPTLVRGYKAQVTTLDDVQPGS